MKLLADEGVERYIVEYLREKGLDIKYIKDIKRGMEDEEVLSMAQNEERILITKDKDFGELVYYHKKLHSGIILNRLAGIPTPKKAELVYSAINQHKDKLISSFMVIQPSFVKIRVLS